MDTLRISLLSLILLITLSEMLLQPHSITYWEDTDALKEFKNGIDPNTVSQSSCLHSWDFTVDPCDHIYSGEKFTCGLRCDVVVSNASRVTEIALDPEANYAGLLSLSSWNLPYLQNLDLSYNSFSGPIPESISNLTQLRRLVLSHNSLSGAIPTSIGSSLSRLEELYLDNNNLQGTIPPSLNGLVNLKRLETQANKLSGEFPELAQLGNLYYLDASDNAISGKLPATLPANLVELAMRNNQITGNIPASISQVVYLQVLDLSHNRLSGSVPGSLFTHPSLQQLSLAYNQFGSVHDPTNSTSRVLNSELIAMDLSNNDLHGILPAFIGKMPKLSAVSLENNKLSGMIPTQYALKAVVPGVGVARLERLLLGGNYLFGPIPGPLLNMKEAGSGSVTVTLGDNCLYRCPMSFFFCQGGAQKSLMECKSFVPVIP